MKNIFNLTEKSIFNFHKMILFSKNCKSFFEFEHLIIKLTNLTKMSLGSNET
jgi:hypothetical protein